MKRFLLLAAFLWLLPSVALAKSWNFTKWDADITIDPNSSILVRETQTYDFHGPYTWVTRDLPNTKGIVYSDIRVFDVNGRELSSREAEITNRSSSANIRLNFSAVDTQKTWTIEYRAWNALGFFSDHDELYWNVVSIERDVSIGEVTATVHLPSTGIAQDTVRRRLLIGPAGSTNESQDVAVGSNGIVVYSGANIAPNESFTTVTGWPKGFVTQTIRQVSKVVGPNLLPTSGWSYIFFAIPFLLLLFLIFRWRKSGRDPMGQGTIIPQYEPPAGARPAVMDVLLTERASMKDITATIIDLAVRGYLRIHESEDKVLFAKKRSYTLERLTSKKTHDALVEYEQKLLDTLFEGETYVKLDDLKNTFYVHIKKLKDLIEEEATKKGYFAKDPGAVRKSYRSIGVVCLGVAGISIMIGVFGVAPLFAFLASGGLFLFFANIMSQRTPDGVAALAWARGFKVYLHTAERFRLKDLPPERFETFLPYAMVFGVEKEWAARFADIYRQPPNWYVGPTANAFLITTFASDMQSHFASSLGQVLASSPSSNSGFGGGGFAGGGGGGGGSGAG